MPWLFDLFGLRCIIVASSVRLVLRAQSSINIYIFNRRKMVLIKVYEGTGYWHFLSLTRSELNKFPSAVIFFIEVDCEGLDIDQLLIFKILQSFNVSIPIELCITVKLYYMHQILGTKSCAIQRDMFMWYYMHYLTWKASFKINFCNYLFFPLETTMYN